MSSINLHKFNCRLNGQIIIILKNTKKKQSENKSLPIGLRRRAANERERIFDYSIAASGWAARRDA